MKEYFSAEEKTKANMVKPSGKSLDLQTSGIRFESP